MLYIGIDPGATGAIAIIRDNENTAEVIDLAVRKTGLLKGKVCDTFNLFIKTKTLNNAILSKEKFIVALEQPQPMKTSGTKNAFASGMNYRDIINALELISSMTNCYIFKIVPPATWKKFLKLEIKGTAEEKKQTTADFVNQNFFDPDIYGCRGGLLDGRSDAIAIAEYARRKWGKK